MLNKLKQLDLAPRDYIVNLLFPALAILLAAWLQSISFLHIDWLRLVEIGIVIFILLSWLRLKRKMQADGVKLREEYEKAIVAHKTAYAALLEDVKNDYKKEIAESKAEVTEIFNSHSTNFSKWIMDHANGHGREQKEFKGQVDALEQKLKAKKLL